MELREITHEITLMGRVFRIRSGQDPEHLEEVTRFLDERLDALAQAQKQLAPQQLALLVALNLADELFQLRREHAAITEHIRNQSRTLLERIAPAA